MSNYKDLVSLINGTLTENGVLKYFYNQLYKEFMPDINGYVIGFMEPPDLSGYNLDNEPDSYMTAIATKTPFVMMDITPPSTQISVAEINGTFGGIPYGVHVSNATQFNITYIDTSDIDIFGMHKIWKDYIRDVTIGEVTPKDPYIGKGGNLGGFSFEPGKCYIDYMASIYILKFRPSTFGQNLSENILYIGKIVGAFPISLPDKELIGRRDANELSILPITYNCSIYREYITSSYIKDTSNEWIVDELTTKLSEYDS